MKEAIEKQKVATRKSGKETSNKIIKTCYDLLSTGSYNDFSMRNIAKNANMRLANVQYYFPTRKDLIDALIKHVIASYHERYDSLELDGISNPKLSFEELIDINLNEAYNLKTQHFFHSILAAFE